MVFRCHRHSRPHHRRRCRLPLLVEPFQIPLLRTNQLEVRHRYSVDVYMDGT